MNKRPYIGLGILFLFVGILLIVTEISGDSTAPTIYRAQVLAGGVVVMILGLYIFYIGIKNRR